MGRKISQYRLRNDRNDGIGRQKILKDIIIVFKDLKKNKNMKESNG